MFNRKPWAEIRIQSSSQCKLKPRIAWQLKCFTHVSRDQLIWLQSWSSAQHSSKGGIISGTGLGSSFHSGHMNHSRSWNNTVTAPKGRGCRMPQHIDNTIGILNYTHVEDSDLILRSPRQTGENMQTLSFAHSFFRSQHTLHLQHDILLYTWYNGTQTLPYIVFHHCFLLAALGNADCEFIHGVWTQVLDQHTSVGDLLVIPSRRLPLFSVAHGVLSVRKHKAATHPADRFSAGGHWRPWCFPFPVSDNFWR